MILIEITYFFGILNILDAYYVHSYLVLSPSDGSAVVD